MSIRVDRETIPAAPPSPLDGSPLSLRLSREQREQLDELVYSAKQPLGVVTRASYVRYLIERAFKEWKRQR